MPKRRTTYQSPLTPTRRGWIVLYTLIAALGFTLVVTGVLDLSCAFGVGLENGVCSQ